MGSVSKELFEQFAQKSQDEINNSFTNTSGGSFDFEELNWTSPDVTRNKQTTHGWSVIRLIGNPPVTIIDNPNPSPSDPVEFMFSEVKDDKGKTMKLRLPVRDGSSNNEHIMWRIISRVMEKEYVEQPDGKKKTIFVNETRHPDVFNMVNKSGWNPGDSKYTFAKSWGGQRVVVFNCIDRSKMDWHRANKHTLLLSKGISYTTNSEGGEVAWPATGVPSFGFTSKLLELVKTYNSKGLGNGWEGFDIGFHRTGTTDNPNIIYNVSAFKKKDFLDEIDGKIDPKIISIADDLTDEEKSWECYDLQKNFAVTSYNKLFTRLGNQIKRIDTEFNTKFYDELKELADKEKAENEAKRKAEKEAAVAEVPKVEVQSDILTESAEPTAPAVETTAEVTAAEPAPIRRSVASSIDTSLLQGWKYLSEEEKSKIERLETNEDGTLKNIVYKDDVGALSLCECGISVPYAFHSCPVCGAKYED